MNIFLLKRKIFLPTDKTVFMIFKTFKSLVKKNALTRIDNEFIYFVIIFLNLLFKLHLQKYSLIFLDSLVNNTSMIDTPFTDELDLK